MQETRTHHGKVRKRGKGDGEEQQRQSLIKNIEETQIRATYEWLPLPSPLCHQRDMLLRAPGR